MPLRESAAAAIAGARGAAVILSANPIHDTGGGQRSAQIALELLARDWAVLFVSHGEVTETVDLGLAYPQPRLVRRSLAEARGGEGSAVLDAFLSLPGALVVTQVPVAEWLPVLTRARRFGARTVFDLIDLWDSELGYGWYRRRDEGRVAAASDALVASAPALVRRLSSRTGRPVALVPNAFNGRLFRPGAGASRPDDLPGERPVVIYVGSLWGGWMDWALVDTVARELPDLAFVFVGDHRGEGAGLPENCSFLGLKPQAALPAYLAHARAAWLPWSTDPVTQATSPLKVFEYLAMGLPVVAPDLEPLRSLSGVVRCGGGRASPTAVAASVGAAVARTRSGLDLRMAQEMRSESWEARVDTLLAVSADPGPGAGPLGRLKAYLGL